MSTPKHTPGPWKLGTANRVGLIHPDHEWKDRYSVSVFASDETEANGPSSICHVIDNHGLPNARLIAAAPELLLDLKSAEAMLITLGGHLSPTEHSWLVSALRNCIRNVSASIAKAEGRE